MNFARIKEAAEEQQDAGLQDRILKNNRWTTWKSRGGPLGPGVESILKRNEMDEAVKYGDPLIVNADGTPNVDGQVQIIKDAKAGQKPAMNYVWLQMQDVTLDKFWHNRIGNSDKRRRRMGHNPEVWTEWLTVAWADLTTPPHQHISPEIVGVSALDGFKLDKSQSYAAFSNLANRFGFLLRNSAAGMNNAEHRAGAKGVPFADEEEDGTKKSKEPQFVQYDPKYMDSQQEKDTVTSNVKSTEDAAFEEIFKTSEEAEGFFEAITDIVHDPKSKEKAPKGTTVLEPFLYFIGEPMGKNADGTTKHPKTFGALLDEYPKEDSSVLYKYIKYTFPKMLGEWGITMEEFLKYANDQDTNQRLRKIIKDAV